MGIDKDDDLIFASINEVASISKPQKAKDEIAIVHAEEESIWVKLTEWTLAKLVEDLTKNTKR